MNSDSSGHDEFNYNDHKPLGWNNGYFAYKIAISPIFEQYSDYEMEQDGIFNLNQLITVCLIKIYF